MDKALEEKCDKMIGLLKGSVKARKEGKIEKANKMTQARIDLQNKTVNEPQHVDDSQEDIVKECRFAGEKPIAKAAFAKDAYGRTVVNNELHRYHTWSDTCKLGVRYQQNLFDREANGDVRKARHADLSTLAKEGKQLWRKYIEDGLRDFQEFIKEDVGVQKANAIYTTNSGYGAEWIPEIWSRDLIDIPHLPHVLVDNLPKIQMPTKNYTYGAFNGDMNFLIGSEQSSTDPSSRVGAVDVATREVNFAAKKLEARLTLSSEETEDAIFNSIVAFSDKMRKCAAYDLEDVIINGDDGGTHMDSDVTASTDRRKLFDGLRRWEQDNDADVDLSTMSLANLAGMRTSLGAGYQSIEDLVYVGSPVATVAIGAASIGFETKEKFGDKAFVLTGQIGTIAGIPYIESQRVRTNLNASGVYDGTTITKTVILLVHRPSVGVGFYKNLTLQVVAKPEYDLVWIIGRMRVDLQPLRAASDKLVVVGYNFS